MKIPLPLGIISVGFGMICGASATVLIYEPYRIGGSPAGYTAGLSAGSSENASVQPAEGSWAGNFEIPSGTNYVVSASGLSYAGLPTTGGSIYSTATGTNRRAISNTNMTSAVYYSYLIRFDDFGSAAVLLGLTDTAYNNVSGVRIERVSDTAGLLKVHSNNSYSSTSYALGVGTTYLVVGKWTPGEVSDTTQLWINPVAGGEPPLEATLQLAAGKGARVAVWNSFIHTTGLTSFTYDEFRMGTTWESVTQIPEPSGLLLFGGALFMLASRRVRGALTTCSAR